MSRKIKPELAWGDYLELHIMIDIGKKKDRYWRKGSHSSQETNCEQNAVGMKTERNHGQSVSSVVNSHKSE